jgi:hypothetical protein
VADGPREQCSSRVLRVLARLRFRSVLVLSFGWMRFRTVRSRGADSPRVPGGRSACSQRSPFFGVRYWRFCWLFRIVRGPGRTVHRTRADNPRYLGGQSAWPVRTVRPSWPDGPPEPGCFALWFESSLLSFMLPRVLQEIVPKT